MNDIQIFNNEEFGAVRTTGTPEQPLFCLADVARVLGLKTSKLVQRLSDDVLSKYPISDSLGREQVTNFINEDGLYDVILDSRKPEAKRFRKWVTSEVLPSIRKHGAYMTQQTIEKALAEPDFLIRLAVNLKEERQKRLLVEQECEHQRTRIVELGSKVDDLQQEVTEMKDKVSYLDIILATKSSVLVTQIAQDYGESSIRFNRRLKEMNIQYQRGKQWILYADYKDCGYVTSETYLIKHKDGTEDVRMNTKWTQKGRRFLYEKLKSVGVIPVIELADTMLISINKKAIDNIYNEGSQLYHSVNDLVLYATGAAACSTSDLLMVLDNINNSLDLIEKHLNQAYFQTWRYVQLRMGYWKEKVYRTRTKEEILEDAFSRWKVAGKLDY